MRYFRPLTIVLAVAVLGLSPCVARATVVGLEITGGYASFEYGAVNEQLAMMNEQMGTSFGSLQGGGGMGFGLRIWPTDRWMLRFSTEMTNSPTTTTVENVGDVSFDPMASFFTVDVTYFLIESKPFRIGIGAGAGIADLAGEFKIPGPGGVYDITGDGPEGHALLEADFGITKRAGIMFQGGYRVAKVSDTQFDSVSFDPVLETDLTGAYFRIGFSYDWR
jgi:hypothetical protein